MLLLCIFLIGALKRVSENCTSKLKQSLTSKRCLCFMSCWAFAQFGSCILLLQGLVQFLQHMDE